MSIDLNDPTSWPDDIDALEQLAKGDDAGEEATEAAVEKPPAAGEEPPKDEPEEGAKEAPKEEPQDAAPRELVLDGIPVLTKDGKHHIPHHVLAQTRQKAREAEERLQALQAELEALRQKPAEPEPKAPEPEAPAIPQAVLDKVATLKEEWGEDIANQYLENYQVKAELAALKESLKAQGETAQSLKAAYEQEQQSRAKTEEQQIQEAIDHSPTLAAWQVDAKAPWFERSVQMHELLMKTDPVYQGLTWAERFRDLPQKVKALYADAPLVAPPPSQENLQKRAAQKVAAVEAAATPTSLSDLAGGAPVTNSEDAKLEAMSGAELTAYFEKMSPDQLQAYLRSLA